MSITPGTDNAPHPAPLMTAEQQQEAVTLLTLWFVHDWNDPDSGAPDDATEMFLRQFQAVSAWRRV